TAEQAQDRFAEQHGLDLVLIIIDTMAAAAGWKDENDNAQAQKVLNVLTELSARTNTFVMAADHFGKDGALGTRGASAQEGAVDTILAALGDRREDGKIEDTRLAVRKVRDGETGVELPFRGKKVDMGVDDYGEAVSTLVIDWDVQRAPKEGKQKKQSLA